MGPARPDNIAFLWIEMNTLTAPRIAVLVPCYNEALTITAIVNDFRRALPQAAIYVFDNNSTDNTVRIAREPGAIVRAVPAQGKGFAAHSAGFEIETELTVHALEPRPPVADGAAILQAARECLKRVPLQRRLRLLGVRASTLEPPGAHPQARRPVQGDLFC